jgi:hypothetical protein
MTYAELTKDAGNTIFFDRAKRQGINLSDPAQLAAFLDAEAARVADALTGAETLDEGKTVLANDRGTISWLKKAGRMQAVEAAFAAASKRFGM